MGHRAARELGWLGYNVRHAVAEGEHTVQKMMSLLVAEGLEPDYDMRLFVAEADRAWWAERRADLVAFLVHLMTGRAGLAENFSTSRCIWLPNERLLVERDARVELGGRLRILEELHRSRGDSAVATGD